MAIYRPGESTVIPWKTAIELPRIVRLTQIHHNHKKITSPDIRGVDVQVIRSTNQEIMELLLE